VVGVRSYPHDWGYDDPEQFRAPYRQLPQRVPDGATIDVPNGLRCPNVGR
jgi:hypothetical protein